MQNRCCVNGCFFNNSSNALIQTHCGLKFYFGLNHRSEICTELSFTLPELLRTLIMKLTYTEVKFYPEVKSQTGLSTLQVSYKRALKLGKSNKRKLRAFWRCEVQTQKITIITIYIYFKYSQNGDYISILHTTSNLLRP